MEAPRPCVTGCVKPGLHVPDCGPEAASCPCCCHATRGPYRLACDTHGVGEGCGPHAPDPACKGCEPWPATRGLVCGRCASRIIGALSRAADLVVHIRALRFPGGPTGERVQKLGTSTVHRGKASESPAPLKLQPVDDADLIYVGLMDAVETIAPLLGMVGTAPQRAWRTTAGNVAGLRYDSDGHEAAPYADWLLRHVDAILDLDYVAVIAGPDGLADLISSAAARHPMEDRDQFIPDTFCPECDHMTLRRYPPMQPGDDVVVRCTCKDCGYATTMESLEVAS